MFAKEGKKYMLRNKCSYSASRRTTKRINKPGTAKVGAALRAQKKESV